jgi:hypothetical protein
MKTLTALCVLLLAGCAMTPTQKRVAVVVGGALVVGAVAAHGSKSPSLASMSPATPKGCPSGPPKSGIIYMC